MQKKTLLFDLDGTLLPIDTDFFVHHYMKAIAAWVGDRIPGPVLVKEIMAATEQMIRNTDADLTNERVFASHFYPAVQQGEAEMAPIFERFYREQFPALRSVCGGLPGMAREVVEAAIEQGHDVVLATNPLFPRMAIEERMRWIGVDDLPWRLVTTYEEMHACKPQPGYYQEILTKIGRRPEECIMIGNDVQEDGVAGKLGMGTYFVTNHLINRDGRELPADQSGSLSDLLEHIKSGNL